MFESSYKNLTQPDLSDWVHLKPLTPRELVLNAFSPQALASGTLPGLSIFVAILLLFSFCCCCNSKFRNWIMACCYIKHPWRYLTKYKGYRHAKPQKSQRPTYKFWELHHAIRHRIFGPGRTPSPQMNIAQNDLANSVAVEIDDETDIFGNEGGIQMLEYRPHDSSRRAVRSAPASPVPSARSIGESLNLSRNFFVHSEHKNCRRLYQTLSEVPARSVLFSLLVDHLTPVGHHRCFPWTWVACVKKYLRSVRSKLDLELTSHKYDACNPKSFEHCSKAMIKDESDLKLVTHMQNLLPSCQAYVDIDEPTPKQTEDERIRIFDYLRRFPGLNSDDIEFLDSTYPNMGAVSPPPRYSELPSEETEYELCVPLHNPSQPEVSLDSPSRPKHQKNPHAKGLGGFSLPTTLRNPMRAFSFAKEAQIPVSSVGFTFGDSTERQKPLQLIPTKPTAPLEVIRTRSAEETRTLTYPQLPHKEPTPPVSPLSRSVSFVLPSSTVKRQKTIESDEEETKSYFPEMTQKEINNYFKQKK
jgi:hypothetical protein